MKVPSSGSYIFDTTDITLGGGYRGDASGTYRSCVCGSTTSYTCDFIHSRITQLLAVNRGSINRVSDVLCYQYILVIGGLNPRDLNINIKKEYINQTSK